MKFFDFPYLVFSAITALVWGLFYALRPDLRPKIWFSSLVACVLGVTEICFVPAYWEPAFPRIQLFRDQLYLESLLFSFFLGGVASVFYEVGLRVPSLDAGRVTGRVLFSLPGVFFLYPLIPQVSVMYFCIGSLLACAYLVYRIDRRLGKPMLVNGLLLFVYALVVYLLLWHFYPSVRVSYKYHALSGINIWGIPVEELLFFFSFGTIWCLFYGLIGNGRARQFFPAFYSKSYSYAAR